MRHAVKSGHLSSFSSLHHVSKSLWIKASAKCKCKGLYYLFAIFALCLLSLMSFSYIPHIIPVSLMQSREQFKPGHMFKSGQMFKPGQMLTLSLFLSIFL